MQKKRQIDLQRISANFNDNHLAALRKPKVLATEDGDSQIIQEVVLDFMKRFRAGYRPNIDFGPYVKVWQGAYPAHQTGVRRKVHMTREQFAQLDEIAALLDIGRASVMRLALYERVEQSLFSQLSS